MIPLIKLSAGDRGKVLRINEFNLLGDLDLICATHCTQYKEKIKELYPEKFIECSAGKIIQI